MSLDKRSPSLTTADGSKLRCLGNTSQHLFPLLRASDPYSPFQGYIDRGQTLIIFFPYPEFGNDSDMVQDMNEVMDMELANFPGLSSFTTLALSMRATQVQQGSIIQDENLQTVQANLRQFPPKHA
ncbi:hypothetical protein TNIN_15981 [Trichonephila inaurata madagascariensis]|uniref:Uncharacterized protein n=1 Tax=Trichonephila inaurata madagascariensis TaxID=2747483 RepID=A0A8X6Y818_9ARAC|nr:hypothetical protein TNIN_15981 [Trichonephila inaurata madagascariensis]